MHAGPLTAFAASLLGAGSVAQQAADDASVERLLFQSGGVAVALGVGWLLLRRSDAREEKLAAQARELFQDERSAHEATRHELVEEKARRMAAEARIDRLARGDTRQEDR